MDARDVAALIGVLRSLTVAEANKSAASAAGVPGSLRDTAEHAAFARDWVDILHHAYHGGTPEMRSRLLAAASEAMKFNRHE